MNVLPSKMMEASLSSPELGVVWVGITVSVSFTGFLKTVFPVGSTGKVVSKEIDSIMVEPSSCYTYQANAVTHSHVYMHAHVDVQYMYMYMHVSTIVTYSPAVPHGHIDTCYSFSLHHVHVHGIIFPRIEVSYICMETTLTALKLGTSGVLIGKI